MQLLSSLKIVRYSLDVQKDVNSGSSGHLGAQGGHVFKEHRWKSPHSTVTS